MRCVALLGRDNEIVSVSVPVPVGGCVPPVTVSESVSVWKFVMVDDAVLFAVRVVENESLSCRVCHDLVSVHEVVNDCVSVCVRDADKCLRTLATPVLESVKVFVKVVVRISVGRERLGDLDSW